ncbi:FAD-dependent oxidoreductase [Actinopolymorpha alba]|uniref:FAD-dependent oxidoreductase n=1 Tax=Actinopolymorpha alba TaxID=533267 RepID=UPI000361189A|nr:FAD-dependent oxidoreductase [Actinopolymorpha alba]
MHRLDHASDITVVGGGLAGVCAAIAAARHGARVALVQNRPVLGGNASSEIRVWVCGATAHGVHQWARETGIMGELFVENQFRNPEGNPYYWDLTVLEAVRAEPNIALFLNTDVHEVAASGPADRRTITAVTGWQQGSEKSITFTSPVFLDCTGDGLVGHLAGAEVMTGREAREVFGEPWAPEVPDNNTLGSTILFYSKDAGQPSKFVPPSFAVDLGTTAIPDHRVIRTDMKGCAFWWIEWGGELDVVADNERIRDELQAVVYGIWDHIKNSGRYDGVENLTLEWIGSVPGKREYRRFVGDHVLTQHNVLGQTVFDDAIGFGGWSIDLHPPGGVYATEPGSRHWYSDGTYDIPLRSLYSRNVTNLWMAGRNISASHVAFGSTRVMATCAVLGEAAGLGAAVALAAGLTPHELAGPEFTRMRRALVRTDASVVGVLNDDPDDLARAATVHVSSTRTVLGSELSGETWPLDRDLGIVLPLGAAPGALELLADVDGPTTLQAEFRRTSAPRNYLPDRLVARADVPLVPGEKQWVKIDPVPAIHDHDDHGPDRTDAGDNVLVVVRANPAVRLWASTDWVPGVAHLRRRDAGEDEKWSEQFREWRAIGPHDGVVFRVVDPIRTLAADRLVGGYARPYGGPQLWSSADLDTDPTPTVELRWDTPVTLSEVQLVLDDDVATDLINLHHHRTPDEVLPTLVRDYDLELHTRDGWQPIDRVRGNRRRHRRHHLTPPRTGDALRVRVLATNGHDYAHVIKLRAYR